MKLLERITVEPGKCGGRPCIAACACALTDILRHVGRGVSNEEILKGFSLPPNRMTSRPRSPYAARQSDHAVLQTA